MIHFTKRWLSRYYRPLVITCSLLAAALISA